jgi:hypothetical protein
MTDDNDDNDDYGFPFRVCVMIRMIMLFPIVTAGITGAFCSCILSSSSFCFRTVEMMMVVVMLLISDSTTSQGGLLSNLTTSLMSAQIIQPGKSPLTPQAVKLAQHVLVLGSVRGHVAFEIAPLAVQILSTDVAVHLVALVAARHVLVADLLVHETLETAGE